MINYNACEVIERRIRYPYAPTVSVSKARSIIQQILFNSKLPKENDIVFVEEDDFYKKEYSYKVLTEIAGL